MFKVSLAFSKAATLVITLGSGVFVPMKSSAETAASTRDFRVFASKNVTPHVDRFLGQDQNAFATIFCRTDVFQVMMVDSRLQDLDGKVFNFDSQDSCERARVRARMASISCDVKLIINTQTMTAATNTKNCTEGL